MTARLRHSRSLPVGARGAAVVASVAWVLACDSASRSWVLDPDVPRMSQHEGDCPTCRPPDDIEDQKLRDAHGKIDPSAGAQCENIAGYLEAVLGTPEIQIDTSKNTWESDVGGHSVDHSTPDINVGEYHIQNDSSFGVAWTLAHEGYHHLYGGDEVQAELAAETCVGD